MMSDIFLALSNLKLEFWFKRKHITLTPTTFIIVLFHTYPFFPPMKWHGHLAWSYFSMFFLVDLQDTSLVTSKWLQATALQSLREQVVLVHKNLTDESRFIKNYFFLVRILIRILILTIFIPTFPIRKLKLLSISTLIYIPLLIWLTF